MSSDYGKRQDDSSLRDQVREIIAAQNTRSVKGKAIDSAAANADFKGLERCLMRGESLQSVGPSGLTPIQALFQSKKSDYAVRLLPLVIQHQRGAMSTVLEAFESFESKELHDVFFKEKLKNGRLITSLPPVINSMSEKLIMRVIYVSATRGERSDLLSLKASLLRQNKMTDLIKSYFYFSELYMQLAEVEVSSEHRSDVFSYTEKMFNFLRDWSAQPSDESMFKKAFKGETISFLLKIKVMEKNIQKVMHAIQKGLFINMVALKGLPADLMFLVSNKFEILSVYESAMKLPGERMCDWMDRLSLAAASRHCMIEVKEIMDQARKNLGSRDFVVLLTEKINGKALLDYPSVAKLISNKTVFLILTDLVIKKDVETLYRMSKLLSERDLIKYMTLVELLIKIDASLLVCEEGEREELQNLRERVYAVFRSPLIELSVLSPSESVQHPERFLRVYLAKLENKYKQAWSRREMLTLKDCYSNIAVNLSLKSPLQPSKSISVISKFQSPLKPVGAETYYDVRRRLQFTPGK